jgi:hypothetical protein
VHSRWPETTHIRATSISKNSSTELDHGYVEKLRIDDREVARRTEVMSSGEPKERMMRLDKRRKEKETIRKMSMHCNIRGIAFFQQDVGVGMFQSLSRSSFHSRLSL